jgi:hypothetical protein
MIYKYTLQTKQEGSKEQKSFHSDTYELRTRMTKNLRTAAEQPNMLCAPP